MTKTAIRKRAQRGASAAGRKLSVKATTSKPAAVTAAKPAPRAIKPLVAIALKPSPAPVDGMNGELQFQLLYVSPAGKETYIACTKSVYLQVEHNRYTRDHRADFRLRLDDNGVVKSVDRVDKPDEASAFNVEGEGQHAKQLVLLVGRDGEVSIKNLPQDMSQDIADEIVNLVEADPNLDSDQLLDGRFMVESITKKAGQTTVIIDPKAH